MADGIFEPCLKSDYLFNHTSGKVSRGTEVEDLCVILNVAIIYSLSCIDKTFVL